MKLKIKKITTLICSLLILTTTLLKAQNTTITYAIDTISLFPNPERGWAHSYNPNGNSPALPLTLANLQNLLNGADHITVIRKYYMLHAYLNSPIDQTFLDKFQADLNTCRTAGVKLVPRFVYIWDPSAANHDAPLNIVIEHIAQIKPYLQNNWDVIAFLETGFVGQYGEWHNTNWNYIDNYSNQILPDGITLRDSLLSALPVNRFLVMRYMYWYKYKLWPTPLNESQAFNVATQARIGYHNDYIMGASQWDCEIGGSNQPTYQTAHNYLMEDTKWVPHTGEPCGDTYYDTHNPQPELRAIHQSTLMNNACIDYSKWKSPKNWYQGLTRDLGYRLSVTGVTYSNIVPGQNFNLSLNLINSGYAAPFNERKFEIILRNTATGVKFITDVTKNGGHATDPRYWLPGNHTVNLSIPVPDSLSVGEYDLILNLPDPAPSLYDRPEYSIRLANQNLWEATTGYNVLNKVISTTGIETVKKIKLNMNIYPNPAHQMTCLSYSLSETSRVVISVYDLLGNEIIQVLNEIQSEGNQTANINTTQLQVGVYLGSAEKLLIATEWLNVNSPQWSLRNWGM